MQRITVKYFSAVRDAVGVPSEELAIGESTSVGDLLELLRNRYPRLQSLLAEEHIIVLVDGKPASMEDSLSGKREVALIPPVSGGSVYEGAVVEDIDHEELLEKALSGSGGEAGAVLLFLGVVKGVVDGAKVLELDYEAYEPFASQKLQEMAEAIGRRYGLKTLVIRHVRGSKRPGEKTLAILAVANSRDQAFKGVLEALERVKTEVPIFKLERREDGDYWVVGDRRRRRSTG